MDLRRRNYHEDERIDVPADNTIVKTLVGTLFGLKVCSVDGHTVRVLTDVDFLFGGNPSRYAYIPLDEVWIDAGLQEDDVPGTILHEIVEYLLMRQKGLSYQEAHKTANDYEYLIREYDIDSMEQALQRTHDIILTGRPKRRK